MSNKKYRKELEDNIDKAMKDAERQKHDKGDGSNAYLDAAKEHDAKSASERQSLLKDFKKNFVDKKDE